MEHESIDQLTYHYPLPLRHSTAKIALHDEHNLWYYLRPYFLTHFPLQQVNYKHRNGTTVTTIAQLYVDFIYSSSTPTTATASPAAVEHHEHGTPQAVSKNLLKLPMYWHRLPYLNLYLFSADSMDEYKAVRVGLKKYLDGLNSTGKESSSSKNSTATVNDTLNSRLHHETLIIYLPGCDRLATNADSNNLHSTLANAISGNSFARRSMNEQKQLIKNYHKIYKELQTAFGRDAVCKIDMYLLLSMSVTDMHTSIQSTTVQQSNGNSSASGNTVSNSIDSLDGEWQDCLQKITLRLLRAFDRRCEAYEAEIRRAMSTWGNKPLLSGSNTPNSQAGAATAVAVVSSAATNFNFSSFFLTKESYAFTFEQLEMHVSVQTIVDCD